MDAPFTLKWLHENGHRFRRNGRSNCPAIVERNMREARKKRCKTRFHFVLAGS